MLAGENALSVQMLLPHFLSFHRPPFSAPPISLLNNRITLSSAVALDGGHEPKKARKFHSSFSIFAAQKDPQHFEVDPDKAREALKKLDQQLSSLSQKPVTPPKKRVAAPEMNFTRDQMREDMPEISGSFLGYTAFALLIFTIFYNVIFYTVIQPSIDLPEPGPSTTDVRDAPKAIVLQQLPSSIPEVFVQPRSCNYL